MFIRRQSMGAVFSSWSTSISRLKATDYRRYSGCLCGWSKSISLIQERKSAMHWSIREHSHVTWTFYLILERNAFKEEKKTTTINMRIQREFWDLVTLARIVSCRWRALSTFLLFTHYVGICYAQLLPVISALCMHKSKERNDRER